MYTTLNAIREHQPCKYGWETLLEYLGKTSADDEPLSLLTVLDSNGFEETLWCFRAVEGFEKERLLLAITYAKEVEHLMPAESKKCLDVFDRYASGLATKMEFEAARRAAADAYTAAHSAAHASDHAAHASWAAAHASAHAAHASWASAHAAHASWAAADAAADASWAASWAAGAAADAADAAYAARIAARAAARSTIQAKQETQFIQLLKDSAKGES